MSELSIKMDLFVEQKKKKKKKQKYSKVDRPVEDHV